MNRNLHLAAISSICCMLAACERSDKTAVTPIEISAIELHKAFAADAGLAEKRFAGKPLVITGEVKMATPPFIGHTMSGEVTVAAKVYFKTEIDNSPSDIKYVVCEGHFEDLASGNARALNPKIKVGESLTIKCESGKIRWSDPGLYISDCELLLH